MKITQKKTLEYNAFMYRFEFIHELNYLFVVSVSWPSNYSVNITINQFELKVNRIFTVSSHIEMWDCCQMQNAFNMLCTAVSSVDRYLSLVYMLEPPVHKTNIPYIYIHSPISLTYICLPGDCTKFPSAQKPYTITRAWPILLLSVSVLSPRSLTTILFPFLLLFFLFFFFFSFWPRRVVSFVRSFTYR